MNPFKYSFFFFFLKKLIQKLEYCYPWGREGSDLGQVHEGNCWRAGNVLILVATGY